MLLTDPVALRHPLVTLEPLSRDHADDLTAAREGLEYAWYTAIPASVPDEIEVHEHGVRYLAAPRTGQKTGAFLDQRENRVLAGDVARGRALDCFSYHGSFALHLARNADEVTALDMSAAALRRAQENAARNGYTNVRTLEANAFDYLRDAERARESFDTIVLDPPAFAKTRAALPTALRGYKEINLRAMRLVRPGGLLLSDDVGDNGIWADFCKRIDEPLIVVRRQRAYAGIVRKPLDAALTRISA